jgi:hypothetical protein
MTWCANISVTLIPLRFIHVAFLNEFGVNAVMLFLNSFIIHSHLVDIVLDIDDIINFLILLTFLTDYFLFYMH